MPNIRENNAPANLGLNPTETGVDAIAKSAQRVGMFYNQYGNATAELGNEKGAMFRALGNDASSDIKVAGDVAVKTMDHEQINHGSAEFATVFNNLTQQYNQKLKNADPNDPSFVGKFNEEVVQPAMEQFKSGFSTENAQTWADAHANELQNHFMTKGAADLSTLAGIAVKQNYAKTVNNLSSAVANDPSSLDFALASVDHSVGAMVDSSPTLDATKAAAVKAEAATDAKEKIVKSAISGMITKNPNVDLDAIQKKYGEYINGSDIKMFQKAAQTQAKVDAYHDKSAALAEKQLADLSVHQGATKVMTDNVSIDPVSGRPIIDPKYFNAALDLAKKNPSAPSAAATVRTMLDWGETQMSKADHTTDPTTASALDSKMWVTENPTTKLDIMRAEADKKISRPDAEIRMKLIDQRDKMPTDPQYKFAMDGAKELIDGRTPGEKSMQAGKYAAFMQDFLQQYQRQKAAGTLPPDALSLRNPDSLISKTMEAYKSPLAAAISGNGGVGPAPSNVPAPATTPKYNEGDVINTSEGPRRFKGGNYRDKKNWEPVS